MNENETRLDRREFTLAAALLALSGVSITIGACGGGGSSSPTGSTPTPAPSGDKVGTISANHGHTVSITAAQLTAAGALDLELTTGNGHTHRVQLTAAEVGQIAGNTRVTKTSSTDGGHSHDVTFN